MNYAAKANEEAEAAKSCLRNSYQADSGSFIATSEMAEAQVHATLATAYATLASYAVGAKA